MNASDLVSVIMPTWNRAQYVGESVGSVLQQTYSNIELIIVDDGSTDGTQDVVNKIADARCKYFWIEAGANISRARNFGIQHSQGAFIAYIDSDDLWEQEKIHKQLDALAAWPEKAMVFTDVIEFKENGIVRDGIYKPNFLEGSITFKSILDNKLQIYPSSILYKRESLMEVGSHDEGFRWNDLGFITRLMANGGGIIVPEKLTRIRKHQQNISVQLQHEAVGYRDMITTTKKLFEQRLISKSEFEGYTSKFYLKMAEMYRSMKDIKKAREAYRCAYEVNPRCLQARWKYVSTGLL
jgi:glycosyltransferase involved in cell wall biosynthesis